MECVKNFFGIEVYCLANLRKREVLAPLTVQPEPRTASPIELGTDTLGELGACLKVVTQGKLARKMGLLQGFL
jgi:hypothetical protein